RWRRRWPARMRCSSSRAPNCLGTPRRWSQRCAGRPAPCPMSTPCWRHCTRPRATATTSCSCPTAASTARRGASWRNCPRPDAAVDARASMRTFVISRAWRGFRRRQPILGRGLRGLRGLNGSRGSGPQHAGSASPSCVHPRNPRNPWQEIPRRSLPPTVLDCPPMSETLPLFPLNTVLLPGAALGLRVFEPRYLDLVRECGRRGSGFGVCLIAEGAEAGAPATPEDCGTEARIEDFDTGPDGLLHLRL